MPQTKGATMSGDCQPRSSTEMPKWYCSKKKLNNTPSIQDGLSIETERRYRKEGARFISICGTQMSLGHNTIGTGVVYFHRFYMFHSFKSFPRYVTACCCLFLAGKVEETPKKCRDIIKTAKGLLSEKHFYSFGHEPKEEVMMLERILLQTMKFDLHVDLPHTYIPKYAKCFKGDNAKLQRMAQMAWNFVNDSLTTTVCLQWEPEIIAIALIHLASKLSKFTVTDWNGRKPSHLRWWDMFVGDLTMDIIEDICHQVLDLYQTQEPAVPDSPPQKPSSRAESPTTTAKRFSLAGSPKTESPTAPEKNMQVPTTPTPAASSIPPLQPPPAAPLELSNIQPIPTLGSSTNIGVVVTPEPLVPTVVNVPPQPLVASADYGPHHMYQTPPPFAPNHNLTPAGVVPPPIPPPPLMPTPWARGGYSGGTNIPMPPYMRGNLGQPSPNQGVQNSGGQRGHYYSNAPYGRHQRY